MPTTRWPVAPPSDEAPTLRYPVWKAHCAAVTSTGWPAPWSCSSSPATNAPPATITLDLDHTDDATYGQQALSFCNSHYGHHCYLPLLVFEAHSGALVTAVLRPGKRPTGASMP